MLVEIKDQLECDEAAAVCLGILRHSNFFSRNLNTDQLAKNLDVPSEGCLCNAGTALNFVVFTASVHCCDIIDDFTKFLVAFEHLHQSICVLGISTKRILLFDL